MSDDVEHLRCSCYTYRRQRVTCAACTMERLTDLSGQLDGGIALGRLHEHFDAYQQRVLDFEIDQAIAGQLKGRGPLPRMPGLLVERTT